MALAESDIYLTETDGDMRLIDPAGVGTTASVSSNTGNVSLTSTNGNILDVWGEEVASLTDSEAQTKAEELGIAEGNAATLTLINGQLDSEEQKKTEAYHRYWNEYRGAVQAGDSGLITISDTDLSITVNSLSVSDLAGADYEAVDLTDTDSAADVALSADQLVKDVNGNLYTVDADITYALADADLSSASGFTVSEADHDAGADIAQTFAVGDIITVADTPIKNNDLVVLAGGSVLQYTGSSARIYLPFASASNSSFSSVDTSNLPQGTNEAAQTSSLSAGDAVYNTFQQTYYVYLGTDTSSWNIPTGDTDDWRAALDASEVPSTATRYEFVGTAGSVNLGNIVDFAGNSNFDKETLDADLVNPSFPDVETNDLVLAENGVLWKYIGTDELVSPDLSNEDFSGDWAQQTYFDVAELATVALADGDVVETDDGTLYEVSGSATAANLIGLDDPVFSGASSATETLTGSETLEAGDIVENTTTGDFYVYKGDNLWLTPTRLALLPTATSSDWAKLSTFTIDHDLTARQ